MKWVRFLFFVCVYILLKLPSLRVSSIEESALPEEAPMYVCLNSNVAGGYASLKAVAWR